MNKLFVFLFVSFSLLVSLSLSSKASAKKNRSPFVNPVVTPTPFAEIERVETDKREAIIPCHCYGFELRSPFRSICGTGENGEVRDNLFIRVKTIVRNPKNTPVFYEYKVSGGKIVGQGSEVLWNLERTRPGIYTVTASISGSGGVSAETTALTVTVRECDCHCPCVCPELFIRASERVRASESFVLSVKPPGGLTYETTYEWTVSQGEIVQGQGTSQIKVKTSREMTGEIAASVEINNPVLCAVCPKTASKTVPIIK